MTIRLPDAIKNYFEMSNGSVPAQASECFSQDAAVLDEGGTYKGHTAISSWIKETREKYEFSAKPINITTKDQHEIVEAEVSGNFPGSPAVLTYSFLLNNDKIQSLEIS
ncbi:nuclear transport factor 2 family protein [Idiomarina sp. M1R2S28]|uniref:Nuclear transport factor 2 family protein n=1 Tax=Idiomarina rhizosphaerae TaxID=2961572 RepID=A0A9X2JQ59_9GAMM|nr:nuclear transport factor 2 family protein [Idiomarina rhizosphaerae]MCP1338037.1 nuclear transport factor 2 family protein [Idiomarina rhizosphaerae]